MTGTIIYKLMANPPKARNGKRRRISHRWVKATFLCKSMAEAKRLDAYLKSIAYLKSMRADTSRRRAA